MNYAGHGSVNLWATERVLDNRGGRVPVGRLDADQLRHVPVRGEHELSDGLLHLPADGRLRGGLVAVAGRGVVVAGLSGRGGGADAYGDDGHRGSAPAVQCALRGDLHAGPPDAGPGGGLRAAAAVGQRGLAVRADEQHVHVLRGPGDRAEGAAAAAAAGVDGGVAGRRPGGVGLECGARLRRGRGRGLPPLPAQRRRSELHAGERGADHRADATPTRGWPGRRPGRLLLRALRGGRRRRRECEVRPGRGHHPAGGRVLRRRRWGGGGGCFVETVVNEGSHERAGATGIAWAVTLLWIAVLHAGTKTRYTVLT